MLDRHPERFFAKHLVPPEWILARKLASNVQEKLRAMLHYALLISMSSWFPVIGSDTVATFAAAFG
jgi:membrane protein YqaA with SNARE-associated domain